MSFTKRALLRTFHRLSPASRLFLLTASGFASAPDGAAQLTPPSREPVVGARMPALSPDGKQIAFVYRGDIWLAPDKSGRATPLTQHVETDAYPLFSPDGRWIAFASRRSGNWDIYAVPAEGGAATRLTWHSGADVPQGWSPDGRSLLFSSKRDSTDHAIYALDTQSLQTTMLCEDFAPLSSANYSPDGKTVVYGRYGFHWTRPRYRGSAAAQVWLLDVADRSRRALTTNDSQHLWTRWLPDGKRLVTVTSAMPTPSSSPIEESVGRVVDNPNRTPNLWTYDLEGKARPLTKFTGGAVRWPCVASRSGDIAFEYQGDLWLLKDGRSKPEKMKLYAAGDDKQTATRREKLTSGVSEAEPSPDGKSFAFALRGEVWTIATEKPKGVAGRGKEFARRLTDWAGDDSDFSWSPDGKKLYFTSDRGFTTGLYELDLKSGDSRLLWDQEENITRLTLAPDGKRLTFWLTGKEGGLYVLPLDTREPRRIVRQPGPQWHGMGGGDYAWSPDMKWLAYAARSESRAWNIFVVPAEGGEPVSVTRLYASHSDPAWSPDGKYLFFQSNREGEGLYALPLQEEPIRTADTDLKFEKPQTNVTVEIDFKDIHRRIRKLASQSPQSDLTVTPDGTLLFISEGDLWSVSYDGKETKRLTTGGGKASLRVIKEAKKISYTHNGDIYTAGFDAKSAEKVAFTAEYERDTRAERRAAFTQFWNSYNRGFYDPNFHGRDWAGVRQRYEPWLDAVETADEFASLLHAMVGELETSHAEVKPQETPGAPVTPHLGFSIDYTHPGPGLRVGRVPPRAPGHYPKTRIREGEYVLAINGRDVQPDERLYEWINDRQDREFEFLVHSNASKEGARTVKYKVLSQDDWADLHYRHRVERARQRVEQHSGGKAGYIHLAAMSGSNQSKFEREAYEYMAGKDALIIDVRFNSGGNIADTLIDWIERKPHGYTRPRDSRKETAPYHAWEKKIVVLMNEHSYSNAEIFPSAMRARGLARLVGMPTPGYVIWTSDFALVDGTKARMPQSGAFRLDGSNLENNGEKPDVQVPLSPEDWLAGRDPQLDKAIELLAGNPAPPARPEASGPTDADPVEP